MTPKVQISVFVVVVVFCECVQNYCEGVTNEKYNKGYDKDSNFRMLKIRVQSETKTITYFIVVTRAECVQAFRPVSVLSHTNEFFYMNVEIRMQL